MDYKEKYEKALQRAKQFSEKPFLEDSKGIVEYIFPELAESEEERIRKALLNEFIHLQSKGYKLAGLEGEKIISWLKSLKPQNIWKPSDEQMKLLDKVIRNPHLSTDEYNGLIALKEQLKAHKGE